MPRARVLLAEDHAAMAEHLRTVLAPEFDVIAIVRDGDTLLAAADALTPDVIVTDIGMPGRSGMAAAGEILRKHPQARIVFVTVHDDPVLVQQCLAAGALGYVLKLTAGEELRPAVQAALRGERYVSKAVRSQTLRPHNQGGAE